MGKWKKTFNRLGMVLIIAAIIDFIIMMKNGNFTIEVGAYFKYEQINLTSIWSYLINSTTRLFLGGIAFYFMSDFISFLIDFYDKVCEIEKRMFIKNTRE